MNIFVLDRNLTKCAEYHCDQHVKKMVIEYAQILSTALHVSGSTTNEWTYLPTHRNHPSNVWVRESLSHWSWLWKLGSLLGSEYTRRYGTINRATRHLRNLPVPDNIPALGWLRDPPQAMPEEYQGDDVVEAYRKFYIHDKSRFAEWKKLGKVPYWYNKVTTV